MKRKILIISLLIISCCLSVISINNQQIFAYEVTSQKIIVKGVGEVFATPNMATISIGVETINLDITKAESENSRVVSGLINVLADNFIEKENIKTTTYSIYKKHDYNRNNFLGYQVTNNFDINIYQLEKVGSIIALLTNNGANVLRGVSFSVTNKDELQIMALQKALQSANNKAFALDGENMVITKIIEEGVNNYFPVQSDMAVYSTSIERNNIIPGECKVRASIIVEYETKHV